MILELSFSQSEGTARPSPLTPPQLILAVCLRDALSAVTRLASRHRCRLIAVGWPVTGASAERVCSVLPVPSWADAPWRSSPVPGG